VYVSLCEVHRLLRSFEHVVRKPVLSVRHLNEVHVARVVTLVQEGWSFRHVALDLNVRKLFAACGIGTMRQVSLQGGLDKVVDA
jgi:hypothetical protein